MIIISESWRNEGNTDALKFKRNKKIPCGPAKHDGNVIHVLSNYGEKLLSHLSNACVVLD